MERPIFLSYSFPPAADNSVLEAGEENIRNPYRTPMWVDRITWRVQGGSFSTNKWVESRADIRLGRSPVTDGFVPIGLLSTQIQEDDTGRRSFTWVLPKPLYVPATELLIIRMMHTKLFPDFFPDIQVRVGVAARSISADAQVPEVVHMPWAASFIGPIAAAGTTTNFQTTEADLRNPFNEPLKVQRFMGRGFNPGVASNEEFLGGMSSRTLVRAVDSNGTILIRDPTPFLEVFFYGLRSWTCNAVLPPKGFYIFNVEQNYADVIQPTSFGVGLSVIGHREVRLR